MTFDQEILEHVPPRSHPEHLRNIYNIMGVGNPQKKTELEGIVDHFSEAYRRREMLILISDLLAEREGLFKALERARFGRHDVLLFHVLDDDELEFPFAGTTRFEGLEEMGELTCDPRALRADYLVALDRFLNQVRRHCVKTGVDYQLIRTSDNLDAALTAYISRRMAIMRRR